MIISVLVGVTRTEIIRVAVLGQLPGEELVELGLEHPIGHKLPLLRHLGRHDGLSCRSESSNKKKSQLAGLDTYP